MDAPTSGPRTVFDAVLVPPQQSTDLSRTRQRQVLRVPPAGPSSDDGRFEVHRSAQQRSPLRLFAEGELCAYSVGFLAEYLEAHSDDDVVFDMWSVTFVDSTAMSTLLQLRQRFRERGGTLVLRNPSAAVCRLVSILGLAEVLFGQDPG